MLKVEWLWMAFDASAGLTGARQISNYLSLYASRFRLITGQYLPVLSI